MIVFLNRYQKPRPAKLISGGVIVLAVFVGLSRISLQVHTPVQVAAGFVLGALFAFLWYWTEEHLYEHPTGLLRHARRRRHHR
jgi:membrane-associated phospholipid phosphatase